AEAQRKLDELQRKLADAGAQAKAEAQEEVSKAKAEADKLANDAAQALSKAKAAYKEEERHDLAALAKDMDELRVKAAKAPPKVKAQVDKSVKDLGAKRDAAQKEIQGIDKATLETLRQAKAKVDQRLAELKQAIRSLR